MPHILNTDSTLTLWWEKPAKAAAHQLYTILADGRPVAEVSRTHYTMDGLAPETCVAFEVRSDLDGELFSLRGEGTTGKRRRRIDVTQPPYSAVGDGKTLNTAALQRAFDDCGPGDCVYLPAGVYMTGALRGHSDMEIYLDEGAVLQGTAEIADYEPRIRSRFEGTEMMCYSSVLNFGTLDHASGPNCQNVLIHGKGTIASGGQTLAWRIIEDERERLKAYLAENAALVATCENDHTIPGRVRPRLINLSNCQNVRISGLTLRDGASWNVHMIYSRDVTTDHCTFESVKTWNGDGWDPDSSEDCTLFASRFFTEDDSVAIKSGKNPEGNEIHRPTRRIRVFDCFSAFGHGIVIGSEMSGGVEDVKIWDCDLRVSMNGFEIKATKKRGGYVRNVSVRDCVLPRVIMHAVGYNDDGVGAKEPPVFEDGFFERLALTGQFSDTQGDGAIRPCAPVEIVGFDVPGHEARRMTFKDITIPCNAPGIVIKYAKDITFERVRSVEEV